MRVRATRLLLCLLSSLSLFHTVGAWVNAGRICTGKTSSCMTEQSTSVSQEETADSLDTSKLDSNIKIRLANEASNEEFLWEMLYYASHSHLEPNTTREMNRQNPDLVRYVADWGNHEGDLAVIAHQADTGKPIGAAWVRLLCSHTQSHLASYVDDKTPELAIAVHPNLVNQGIGGKLLDALLEESRGLFPAICLSVRATSPAVRFYRRFGFETVKIIKNRVGTDSVKMLCRLTD